jgi:NAD(P)-dependent dehydrogenase (short-subunit alcohol dehydrogenase family)
VDAKKTVIVTGASSGIGLAISQAYLNLGYNVVGNARTMARLEAAAESIGSPENFLLVDGDIGRRETARRLFASAVDAFGKVDILIANAGIFIGKPVTEFTDDDIDSIIDTNVRGFVYPAQEAVRHMTANGSGHIISISACIAMAPNGKLPAMMTALVKGGLNHAVRALAVELGTSGVQVNAVAPGIIDTPIFPRDPQVWDFLRTLAPNGRTGVPQDVVDAVLYLTGSTYVTGAIMTVDGGSTAGVW